MRSAVAILLLALVATGCTGAAGTSADSADRADTGPDPALEAGCSMVPASRVVGILGPDVESTSRGSVPALAERGSPLRCSSMVPGRPERYVTFSARRHPRPVELPADACNEGWVYAGTADKFAPACQQFESGRGTTRLIVRWQPYVVRVAIGRPDREWAGDPEAALALSRSLAQRLGVAEATGDG